VDNLNHVSLLYTECLLGATTYNAANSQEPHNHLYPIAQFFGIISLDTIHSDTFKELETDI
jgi:hypothetical protein